MTTDTAIHRPTTLAQVLPGMLPAGSYSLEQLEHLPASATRVASSTTSATQPRPL